MKFSRMLSVYGCATALCLCAGSLSAQDNPPPGAPPAGAPPSGGRSGRGNFDPAQMQQRILDGVKERLAFSDSDWTAVQPLVQKVVETQRDARPMGMGGLFRGRRGGDNRGGDTSRSDRGNRPSFFGAPSPEAEALQKAIDDKAPAGQIKAALEKYRASRKEKEAKLAAAQEDLRKVLSANQEAQATLLGLLP